MRFSTITLGCKVNQYETGTVESALCELGYEHVRPGEGCDLCIINTCAVTVEAERKSRQQIQRMKKLEPDAEIMVCGCYSQLKHESVKQIGADFISGTIGRYDFPPGNSLNKTRALLKIQDGCDNFCTYCIVPHIRGRSRSVSLERIAGEAKQLEKQGYKEIIITGIELSSFSPNLIDAITTIGNNAPNARLRLGSLDPAKLTDKFCQKLVEVPKLCDHFHLSLQSGCDEILRKMGRKYTTDQVLKSIDILRNCFPDCAITADLITGFPGETEYDFKQTLSFIKKAAFSDMHIFPYSRRPGTKAAEMPEQIEKQVKKERARIAIEAAKKMTENYNAAQIGKTFEVLIEQEKNGFSKGHLANYLLINIKDKLEKNSLHGVKITSLKNGILTGEIV